MRRESNTKMKLFVCLCIVLNVVYVMSEIDSRGLLNKLRKVNAKPVGPLVKKKFVPLTEIPPPASGRRHQHVHKDGRRHFADECSPDPGHREVEDGQRVDIINDYYDERVAKTVATVIFPDHIDHKHFEITTQVPYLTVGHIEAMGYHPSTIKGSFPSECEKIYQDHLEDQYSDESVDYSEESLEVARMPLFPRNKPSTLDREYIDKMYSDEFQ